jgi:hypothetical protein
MARIEPEDIEEVADIDLPPTDVQAFIDDAHRIVQRRCAEYASERDQKDLAMVEVYLGAHLMMSKSPQVTSTSAEGISASFAVDGNGDDYWHKAILADPTGRLARPDGWNIFTTH